MTSPPPSQTLGPQVLLTAAEAFPALEDAFLRAEREIWASFRIFDLKTPLRSDAALALGDTWFDLMVQTLRRGVAVTMILTDFDPIARPRLHRGTWQSVRLFHAAAEVAGPGARLTVRAAMHSAETGLLPRLVFWPQILHRLGRTARWLRALPVAERTAALRDLPGLRDSLRGAGTGPVRPRPLPIPRLFPATHHQKLAVFDRKRLYIGGLDLDDRRYDTPDHDRPGHETWHDVQLLTEGPAVADAQAHLETFLDVVAGRRDPAPVGATGGGQRFLRTLSRRRPRPLPHFGPEPVLQEIAAAHDRLAAGAERLIYVETQFFRDRWLARRLARAARRNPRLTMILVLPAAPEDVAFDGSDGMDARLGEFLQARSLRILRRGFGRRLFIGGAAQPRRTIDTGRAQLHGAPLVYIHAKVSVFDDRAAIVSSANLNGRSLRWDTEAGLLLDTPAEVAPLRQKVMAHWLPPDAGPGYFHPDTAAEAWFRLGLANARRPAEQRRGFILPYDLKAAETFGRGLPLVPDEMM